MYITKLINKALSDADLQRILGGDAKIIKYSELSHLNDLDELLPKDKDYCVVLYEERLDLGHWTALSKYDGVFEHFDPYGVKPDNQLKWLNKRQRELLNQATPYLSNLLNKEDYIYNDIHYQDPDSFVNTCGSHVAHRLYRLKNDDLTLEQNYNYMKSIKNKFDVGYDIIVAEFINKWF
jgi:hypothetical protein